jgi:hypothetical protein
MVMKFKFLGFVAAALLTIGALGHPASATTINVDSPPIDDFPAGKNHIAVGAFDVPFEFHLFFNADLTYDVSTFNISGVSFELRDASNTLVSFNGLLGSVTGVTYFFHVLGTSLANSAFFGGTVTLTATPVPPALILFLTALGGMGFVAYRRKAATTVA